MNLYRLSDILVICIVFIAILYLFLYVARARQYHKLSSQQELSGNTDDNDVEKYHQIDNLAKHAIYLEVGMVAALFFAMYKRWF